MITIQITERESVLSNFYVDNITDAENLATMILFHSGNLRFGESAIDNKDCCFVYDNIYNTVNSGHFLVVNLFGGEFQYQNQMTIFDSEKIHNDSIKVYR